jgi:hypothetical protein
VAGPDAVSNAGSDSNANAVSELGTVPKGNPVGDPRRIAKRDPFFHNAVRLEARCHDAKVGNNLDAEYNADGNADTNADSFTEQRAARSDAINDTIGKSGSAIRDSDPGRHRVAYGNPLASGGHSTLDEAKRITDRETANSVAGPDAVSYADSDPNANSNAASDGNTDAISSANAVSNLGTVCESNPVGNARRIA